MLYRITLLILTMFMLQALSVSVSAENERCFAETGECISGSIRAFWERNGGLDVFGMPLLPVIPADAQGPAFQLFERHSIELHPEHVVPYDVELAQVGRYIFYARSGQDNPSPAVPANPNCRFFAETGHNLCEPFRAFWGTHGLNLDASSRVSDSEALALFGLPLTEAYQETGQDGIARTVQYFERARFELHPENPTVYQVQLGLLGAEFKKWALEGKTAAPQPTDPSAPQPTPVPAPIPTAAPVPTGNVTITREPGTVRRGSIASVAAHSAANIECDITVEYKSGPSEAAGLYPKTTDYQGQVAWSWKVGTRTTSGSWPVTITCGNASARTYVNVP